MGAAGNKGESVDTRRTSRKHTSSEGWAAWVMPVHEGQGVKFTFQHCLRTAGTELADFSALSPLLSDMPRQ